ncbi:S-adenosyl-L-methionine-dependent methyltransferase, partial [Ochromonadaceae sp. CCMP2298]
DYGCAEGAITAALGKALGLPAKSIIGADVRTIPAEGFTFMPLAAEEPGAETDAGAGAGTERAGPAPGTILPLLADASVDLVTTAMVLHHVTHARAVLLELRRVLSPRGALVLREHHCISTDMGAFLDITHGLYSLSWSQPVEWPDFLDEYKAFYRSREQWTQLLAEAGFDLADEKECGEGGVRNYNSAEARRRTNGSFPNVLKAYY